MKKTILTAIAVLSLSTATHAIGAFGINYDLVHVNAFYGLRTGSDDFKGDGFDLTEQSTYGVDADVKIPILGFNIAGSVAVFTADDAITVQSGGQSISTDIDFTGIEARLGVRKYISILNFGVVAGGGVVSIANTSEITAGASELEDVTQNGFGGYLEAGFTYKFASIFNVGGRAVYSFAQDDGDQLGGTTIAAYVGMVI